MHVLVVVNFIHITPWLFGIFTIPLVRHHATGGQFDKYPTNAFVARVGIMLFPCKWYMLFEAVTTAIDYLVRKIIHCLLMQSIEKS